MKFVGAGLRSYRLATPLIACDLDGEHVTEDWPKMWGRCVACIHSLCPCCLLVTLFSVSYGTIYAKGSAGRL